MYIYNTHLYTIIIHTNYYPIFIHNDYQDISLGIQHDPFKTSGGNGGPQNCPWVPHQRQ